MRNLIWVPRRKPYQPLTGRENSALYFFRRDAADYCQSNQWVMQPWDAVQDWIAWSSVLDMWSHLTHKVFTQRILVVAMVDSRSEGVAHAFDTEIP